MGERTVFLGVPAYGWSLKVGTARAIYQTATRTARLLCKEWGGSLLAQMFNRLWCDALNARAEFGVTHFAMLHSDVQPEPYWLDLLLGELDRTGADLVSAVVPIKDDQGLYSTAVGDPADPFLPKFRVTSRQVQDGPVTFSAADLGHPGDPLLVNTGCFACRFTDEWVEKFRFTIRDEIRRAADGRFYAAAEPEDWYLSRWLWEQGRVALATKAVRLTHRGEYDFPNDQPWGLERDEGMAQFRAARDRPAA